MPYIPYSKNQIQQKSNTGYIPYGGGKSSNSKVDLTSDDIKNIAIELSSVGAKRATVADMEKAGVPLVFRPELFTQMQLDVADPVIKMGEKNNFKPLSWPEKEEAIYQYKQAPEIERRTKEILKEARPIKKDYVEPGFMGQISESVVRTTLQVLSAVGSSIEKAAVEQQKYAYDRESTLGRAMNSLSPKIEEIGASTADYFQKVIQRTPELQQPTDMGKWSDPRYYANLAGGIIPSIAGGFVASAVGGLAGGPPGAVAGGVIYAKSLEGGFAYQEALSLGASKQKASDIADLVGNINATLEFLPIGRALDKLGGAGYKELKKNILRRVTRELVTQGIYEGTTEMLQEITSNAVMAELDENRGLWDNTLESFVGGLMGGAGTGAGILVATDPTIRNKVNNIKAGLSIEDVGSVTKERIEKFIAEEYGNDFVEAINNTKGATISDVGFEIDISRFQKETQHGMPSVREGVFYLPEKNSPYKKYYSTGKNGYGGGDLIEGRTTFINPLVTKAGTGGKGIEKAYDIINGKSSYEKMRREVLDTAFSFNKKVFPEDIAELLTKYNEDSNYDDNYNVAYNILENSKEGNQLAYAIQENIAGHSIKNAGYDASLSFSRSGGKPRLSEVFDVRSLDYPEKNQTNFSYPDFYNENNIGNKLKTLFNEEKTKASKISQRYFEPVYDMKIEDAKKFIERVLPTDIQSKEAGYKTWFNLKTASKLYNDMGESILGEQDGRIIRAVIKGGKVAGTTISHETFHGFVSHYMSLKEYKNLVNSVIKNYPNKIKAYQDMSESYKSPNVAAEEFLADEFSSYVSSKNTSIKEAKPFFQKLLEFIESLALKLFKKEGKYNDLFDTVLAGKTDEASFFDQGRIMAERKKASKVSVGEEQLKAREEAKEKRQEALLKKEALEFPDSELERQYQAFKKLNKKNSEDVEQLKSKNKSLGMNAIDNILYSQDKTDNEVLEMFQERYIKEKTPLPKVPKETKAMVRARAKLKGQMDGIRKGIREGTIKTKKEIKQTQDFLVAIIKESELSLQDKGKFLSTIKNIQTTDQLQKTLPEIENRINTLIDKDRIRKVKSRIIKLLKRTKTSRQFGRIKGKYTPEIQKVLDQMRSASKLKVSEAQTKIEKNLSEYNLGNMPNEIAQENAILNMIAGNATLAEMQNTLSEVKAMVEYGLLMNSLKAFNKQEMNDKNVNSAVKVISGKENGTEGLETAGKKRPGAKDTKERIQRFLAGAGKSMVSWNDLLDMLSFNDKTTTQGKSWLSKWGNVLNESNAEKEANRKDVDNFRKMVRESYNVKTDREVVEILNDLNKEIDLGVFKNNNGIETRIDVKTKDQAIKRFMEFMDPSLDESFELGNAYTQEIKDAIVDLLSEKDIKFAEAQMKWYADKYKEINNVYRDQYGVDLDKNAFYSPIKRDGIDVRDEVGYGEFLQEMPIRMSVAPGSTKSRVKNIKRIQEQGSTLVLQKHASEMNHFINWVDKVKEMTAVFDNSQVKDAIKYYHGPEMLKFVNSFIDDFTRGGVSTAQNLDTLDKIRGKFTQSVLYGKPSIGFKQLTSFIAFADSIPTKDFISGFTQWATNPVTITKFLKENSELLKSRGMNIERDLATAMKSSKYRAFTQKQSLLNTLGLAIQIGDQGAIVMGGWSVYKYHYNKAIKSGKSKMEAKRIGIEEFEKATESAQQSADISQLSFWQRGNSFAKLFTMFMSSPNQYFRKEMGAIRNYAGGRIDTKQFAKTMLIYHVLLPVFFQAVSNMFRTDDESKKEYLRAMVLGSFNGIFIAGDMLESLTRIAFGLKDWGVSIPIDTVYQDFAKAIRSLQADDLSGEDMFDAIKNFSIGTGVLTGFPVKQAFTDLDAGRDIIDGKYYEGMANFLGWSDYAGNFSSTKKKTTKKKKPIFDIDNIDLEKFKPSGVDTGNLKSLDVDVNKIDLNKFKPI